MQTALTVATIAIIQSATVRDRLNSASKLRAGHRMIANSASAGTDIPTISCHNHIFLYERWYLPVMSPRKIHRTIIARNSHTYTRIAALSAATRQRMHNRAETAQMLISVTIRCSTAFICYQPRRRLTIPLIIFLMFCSISSLNHGSRLSVQRCGWVVNMIPAGSLPACSARIISPVE